MATRELRRPTATLLGVSAMAVLALAPSRMGEPVSLRELARAPRMDATQSAVRDAMSVDVTGSIAPARMPRLTSHPSFLPFRRRRALRRPDQRISARPDAARRTRH